MIRGTEEGTISMSIQTTTVSIGEQALSELKRDYAFGDPAAIAAYLSEHPETLSLLKKASSKILAIFPEDTSLTLDVPPDYESDGLRDLFVRIQTRLGVETALELLDRFNEEWWRKASAGAPLSLHFTTEYV
jgi:hypothetical protein